PVLAKGPPAAFVAIFFILLAAVSNRWHVLWRWALTGAPITLAIIALPWFHYIHSLPQWPVIKKQLAIALRGEAHRGPFYQYIPQTVLGTAPWSAFVIVALIAAAMRCRRDPRLRIALSWFGGIFIALCAARQRQPHYLIPTLPALAVTTGWWIDQALSDEREARVCRTLLLLTILFIAAAALATPLVAQRIRGELRADDFYLLAAGVAIASAVGLVLRAQGLARAMMMLAITCPLLLAGIGIWYPTLDRTSSRTIAAVLRARYG